MAQLRQDYAQFATRDAEILVVCPEERADIAAYWQRERLPFAGLADPDHKVADLYGQEVSLLKLGRMPELVIVNKDGKIAYAHHASWMSDIPTNKTLFEQLDRLNHQVSGN